MKTRLETQWRPPSGLQERNWEAGSQGRRREIRWLRLTIEAGTHGAEVSRSHAIRRAKMRRSNPGLS